MAILWSKRINGVEYQVRSAGKTRRLYSNGVFHSQYNPANAFSGALWDMLSLPAALLSTPSAQDAAARVLLLGVGGGAVMRQLRHLLPAPRITGVDIDDVHLKVARRWFGVRGKHDVLVHADAREWLQSYAGEPFDLIIDDLFGESCGQPIRAVAHDKAWSSLLVSSLAPQGLVIANFIDRSSLIASALHRHPNIHSAACLQHPLYHNQVGLFFTREWQTAEWRQQIGHHTALNLAQRRSALSLRLRRL